LLIFALNFLSLAAQMSLEGVTKIGNANYRASFLFKDSRNTIWIGNGSFIANEKRDDRGLYKFENNSWMTVFPTGIFTDILEWDSLLLVSAYDGLYFFSKFNYQFDTSLKQNSCLAVFNSNLVVGTMGNGLFERTLNSYRKIPVIIAGVSYDSIFLLKADGKNL